MTEANIVGVANAITIAGQLYVAILIALVLGREVAMTILRQMAHRRGTVIAAIFAAKLKTAFQLIWVGAAYFWFFVAIADRLDVRDTAGWAHPQIDAVIRSGERRDARLARAVPVYWVYITAWAAPDGGVQVRPVGVVHRPDHPVQPC